MVKKNPKEKHWEGWRTRKSNVNGTFTNYK